MIGNKYEQEKVFFTPGDRVIIKHQLENKPIMLVQSVDKSTLRTDKGLLLGVTCIWFNTLGEIQKNRFNTKDLIQV